jgi:exopolysaccharide production protein ExoQ
MNTISPEAAGQPRKRLATNFRRERLTSLLNYTKYTDPLAMFTWVASTTFNYPFLAPFRYLVAGYFVTMIVLFGRQTMPAIGRSWPLFLIPILCTTSALWAPVPAETLRKGIAMALTGLVAIYAASRLSGQQLLLSYFAAESIAALMSLVMGGRDGSGAWIGIFDQKNFFAIHMFLLYGACAGILFDQSQNRNIRIAATLMAALAGFLIFMAKSGTTTIMFIVVTFLLFAQAFFWGPISKIRHARMFFVLLISIIGIIGSLVVFGILQLDVKEEILKALGKDPTLTGRTYLWEIAKRVMAEHPWTGVGGEGFWRPELGPANSIAQYFHYPRFMGFSFHNSYYENGAAYGYPGFFATLFLATWAITSTALTWFRNQTIVNAAFLVFAAAIVIRTNSEVDLSGEFSGTAVILFIAASRKEHLQKQRLMPARMPHSASR